jgi:hypothetical protein
MGQIVDDIMKLRQISNNSTVIPTIRAFSITKEGYLDLLNLKTVKVPKNIKRVHLNNKKSFDNIATTISKSLKQQDEAFSLGVVYQFSITKGHK